LYVWCDLRVIATGSALSSNRLQTRQKAGKKGAKDSLNSNAPSPLVFGHSTQKRIKLKEQPEVIQDILHHGIAKASEDVFLKKTWPEESARRHIYGTGILLGVC